MDFKDLMLAYETDLRLTDRDDAKMFASKLIPSEQDFLDEIFGNKKLMHPIWEVVKYWIRCYSPPYVLARINEVLIECGFTKCTILSKDLEVVTAKPELGCQEYGIQITPAKIAYSKLLIAKEAAKNLLLDVYNVNEENFHMVITQLKSELKSWKKRGKIDEFEWKHLFPRRKAKINLNAYNIRLMQLLIGFSPKQHCMFWLDQAIVFERVLSHNTIYDLSFNSCCSDHDPFDENLIRYLSENDKSNLSLLERKLFEITLDMDYRMDKDFEIMQRLQTGDIETLDEVAYQDSLENGVMCNLAKPLGSHVGRDINLHKKVIEGKRLVLCGLGGIGKSESLRHYCDNYSSNFDNNILWIDSSNEESIKMSFNRHREYIKKPTAAEKELSHDVYQFFISSGKKFLVVFDNAKNYEELKVFFPPRYPHSYIIISSQSEHWGERFTKIRLEPFNDEEALKLVKHNLQETHGTQKEIRELCCMLGNFPLALQQAVAFIKRGCSIRNYIEEFSSCSSDLLKHPCGDDDYPYTVCTTWKMAFEELSKSGNVEAVDLLNIMAYMNGSCIDCALFGEIEGMRTTKILNALDVLQSFSLVTPNHRNGSCSTVMMHDLVQLVVRNNMYGTRTVSNRNYALTLLKVLLKTALKNEVPVGDNSFGQPWLMHLTSLCMFAKKLDASRIKEFNKEVCSFLTDLKDGKFVNVHQQQNIIDTIERVCANVLDCAMLTEEMLITNGEDESICDIYAMENSPHGLCLIINNTFEGTALLRKGTMKDEERLKETFKLLDFEVKVYQDQSGNEIKEVLRSYANSDHENYDCFVCFILSHGSEGHVKGIDEKEIKITELRNMFGGNKCKSLIGKPKLFFIQACQGGAHNTKIFCDGTDKYIRTDLNEQLILYDFFIYASSISGTVSWRSTKGSYFIQTVCDFLNKDAILLKDLVTKVNDAVSRQTKQMPEAFNSLRKDFLFSKKAEQ